MHAFENTFNWRSSQRISSSFSRHATTRNKHRTSRMSVKSSNTKLLKSSRVFFWVVGGEGGGCKIKPNAFWSKSIGVAAAEGFFQLLRTARGSLCMDLQVAPCLVSGDKRQGYSHRRSPQSSAKHLATLSRRAPSNDGLRRQVKVRNN